MEDNVGKVDFVDEFVRIIRDKLQSPILSKEQLNAMSYLSQSIEVCIKEILDHPNTPREVFESWSRHNKTVFREAVAGCANTPHDILSKLSEDPSESVRIKVAHNPHTPEETIVLLSLDDSRAVRETVKTNPSSPKCTIRFLGAKHREVPKQQRANPTIDMSNNKGLKIH